MVLVMHGVVQALDKTSMVHRNMLDEEAFIDHLRARPPYVGIDDARSGRGDALTIDDATEAGARAAELAREHGSEVVFFVNSHNVAHGAPYFFAILNTALHLACDNKFTFSAREYDLSSSKGKIDARNAIKHRILSEPCEERRLVITQGVADSLGHGGGIEIPRHLKTISIDRLMHLVEIGVTIGNHGRTHAQFSNLDEETCLEEIEIGARWIQDVVGTYPNYFAVPFGEFIPPWKTSKLYALYMLATNALYQGTVGPQIMNRNSLRLPVNVPGFPISKDLS